MKSALSLGLVLALALLSLPAAWAAACRKVVVVYVDVSGSMYERRHCSVSPWSGKRSATLMENTVRFLEHRLLSPEAKVLAKGDRLILRGFYRRVDNLIPPVESFDPNKTPAQLRRIDQVLDFNHNRRYDICDAGGRNCPPVANRFLLGFGSPGTDYRAVVQDMLDIFQGIPVGEERSFARLVFIILSDGAHDYQVEQTREQLQKIVIRAGQQMAGQLASGRVKVVLFRISQRAQQGVVDVGELFRRHLRAKVLSMNPTIYAASSLRDIFTKDIPRLQIEAVKATCLPRRQGDEGKELPPRLHLQLTLVNRFCRGQRLEGVGCRVLRLETAPGQAGPGTPQEAAYLELACGKEIAPPRTVLELDYDLDLPPGSYRARLVPVTAGLGQGRAVEVDFQVPETPVDTGTTLFVMVLLLFLLVGVGAGVWWVWSRMRTSGE